MLKNATYNLMKTASVISKGLHGTSPRQIVEHMREQLDRDAGGRKAA